jgi:hypothetical protein
MLLLGQMVWCKDAADLSLLLLTQSIPVPKQNQID